MIAGYFVEIFFGFALTVSIGLVLYGAWLSLGEALRSGARGEGSAPVPLGEVAGRGTAQLHAAS